MAARCHGFTLIEMLFTVMVAVILLGAAVPSFSSAMARMRLEGTVNNLGIDLQYARSEAVRRGSSVTLASARDGRSYSLSSGGTVLKTVVLPEGVSFSALASAVFEPMRGSSDTQSFSLGSSGANGARLQVTTTPVGRVHLCSPAGSFTGYVTC